MTAETDVLIARAHSFNAEHLQLADGSWPLREQCAECDGKGHYTHQLDAVHIAGMPKESWQHCDNRGCDRCRCSECRDGWTPVTDMAKVMAAIRAKGWDILIDSECDAPGVEVTIFFPGEHGYREQFRVEATDGLDEPAALAVALMRALEKEE